MKNSNLGMTLLEVSVVALGVGLLFMALASVMSSGRQENARVNNRLISLSDLNDFSKNLGEPEFFRSLALVHPDSAALKECFESGCSVGESGVFALDGVDSHWSRLRPAYSWRVVSSGLIEITMTFPEGTVFSSGRSVSFYHSRKDFLNTDFDPKDSDCGEGFDEVPNVVAGIDTATGTFLCRAPFSGVDAWEREY